MALQYSPKIVTDSLVMCLDASNNKSYPTDLPVKGGLLLWLDAADDTTFNYSSGTVVSQWRDKSGNNFHANQSTTAQQPSRNTFNNSRKSVFFNAASRLDYMTISSGISLPTDTSIFIIYKPSTQIYEYAILIDNYHGQGGNYGFVIQRVSTNAQFYYANAGDGTGFIDTAASPWTYTNDVIQLLSLNKASSTGTPYISGTAQTSRSVRAATAQYTTGLGIGSLGAGNGRFYNGDMCEILIFNRSLSSTEMKQVHTYLGQKWGISNTDRQIFDLSGNNFNFSFNGTNPRYNAKTIVSNFNTTTPYAVGSFGGQNLTSTILNLLYVDHTIEVAVNLKGFKAVKSFDNARDYEGAAGIVLWQGYHGGLYVDAATQKLTYLIWNSDPTNVYTEYVLPNDLKDKILYITAKRQANVLSIFINGVLVAGPTSITTTVRSYTQINIGAAYQGDPSSGGSLGAFVWAGQHEYHLLRMYSRALATSELVSNYQAFKARFDNNIVRFGLVLDLDAGNPYSYAGAGTTWYDTSGNAINASATGNINYSNLYNGVFSVYPSVNSYFATSTVSALNLGSSSFSIEAWVYFDASVASDNVYRGVMSLGTDSSNYVYISKWRSGLYSGLYVQYVVAAGTVTGVYQANDYNPVSRWTHVVATKSSNVLYLYVNGVLYSTASNLNTTFTGNSYVLIANGHAGVGTLNGYVGESRVYNISLSAAQVLQNYNATKGRFGL